MINFETIVMYSVILALCFYNAHCAIVSIKDNGNDIVSNAIWSDKLISSIYQSTNSVAAKIGRKVFSPVIQQRKIYPRHADWEVTDVSNPILPARYNRHIWPKPAYITSALTISPYKVPHVWSRFVTPYRTRYDFTISNDYQWKTEDKYQCTSFEDCQLQLRNSQCIYQNGGTVCNCSRNYVKYGNECLIKVLNGGRCNESIQCIPRLSICLGGYCNCPYGYKNEDSCVRILPPKKDGKEKLLWPNIIMVLLLVSAIGVLIISAIWLIKRRKLTVAQALPTAERRQRRISEACAECVDKPPAYDEVMSTSTTRLTLSIEELSQMPPPSYSTVQQTQNK